jgi:hypothetical protein
MSRPEGELEITLLRPYLLTSGRSQPVDQTIEIEAQVLATRFADPSATGLSFELRDIVALCEQPMSIAEVAARLGLHIGVAKVLVSDLVAYGYVTLERPAAALNTDLDMIERVIRGLQAIR